MFFLNLLLKIIYTICRIHESSGIISISGTLKNDIDNNEEHTKKIKEKKKNIKNYKSIN